jgi:hypothetical protein
MLNKILFLAVAAWRQLKKTAGMSMIMLRGVVLLVLSLVLVNHIQAQNTEWLLYTRTIRDAKGNFRFDQNIVPNIKVSKTLRLELGLRHGETTRAFDAYYHYKVELQTRSFWKTLRFVARLSDNIVKAPALYSRSNYLAIAEGRFNLNPKFSVLVGAGGVAQYQRNDVKDVAPSFGGTRKFFPTYRLTARYHVSERWFIDAVYGAYDTFNPYPALSPFVQADTEFDLSDHVIFYGYFRYQFERQVNDPVNDFLGVGIKLRR